MSTTPLSPRMMATAAALLLALGAACDSPTEAGSGGNPGTGGGNPVPQQPAPVASVRISPDTMTLIAAGGYRIVQATVRGADQQVITGRVVEWSISDLAVAHVDPSGIVVAHAPGSAVVYARIEGKVAQARVTVLPLTVDSIALGSPELTLASGSTAWLGTRLLSADGRELYDRPISWSSSDPSVVEVDANGRLRGLAGGTAWITVTSEGRTAKARVTVPGEQVMLLRTVRGAWLPTALVDSVKVVDGDSATGWTLARVRVVAAEGRLTIDTRTGAYEQRLVFRRYERRGSMTPWGSQMWENTERLVREETVIDRGQRAFDTGTGDPLFSSTTTAGVWYRGQIQAQEMWAISQGLPGTPGFDVYTFH
jgi:hypothetical protein